MGVRRRVPAPPRASPGMGSSDHNNGVSPGNTAAAPPAVLPASRSTKATRAALATSRVVYEDGTCYNGQWSNGRQHGYGTCAFASGNVYMGEWKNGQISGAGVMLYSDGSLFDGHWTAGCCDGEGVFYPARGEPFAGVWSNGARTELRGPAPNAKSEKQAVLLSIARAMASDGGMPGVQPPSAAQHWSQDTNVADDDDGDALGAGPEPFGNIAASLGESRFGGRPPQGPREVVPSIVVASDAPPVDDPTATARAVQFAAAGPSYTAEFSSRRFVRYFTSLLLPFLSVPHLICCPLRTNILDLEREYVVSGAALRVDFDAPVGEVYVALLTFCLACLSAIMASISSVHVTPNSRLSLADVVVPFVLHLLYALIIGAYHSHRRVAHALERLDRYQFPRLAKFSSSCVDGTSTVCVATWDDDGENVVYTAHYPRRWTQLAIIEGLLIAACGPIVRGVNGFNPWSSDAPVEAVGATATFLALWIAGAGCTYYFWKINDTQRQVHSRMCVLSRCAYLGRQSVLRPTDHREISFNLDGELDFNDFTKGFVGWYTTRCFALYASTCTNHAGRMAAMSTITLGLLCTYLTAIVDGVYVFVLGYTATARYFTTAHLIGLVIVLTLGHAHLYYLFVCSQTEQERRKHIYLADVAAAYHYSTGTATSRAQAAVVTHCRDIIRHHDVRCTVLSVTVKGHVIWLFIMLHAVGTLVLILQFIQWVAYR